MLARSVKKTIAPCLWGAAIERLDLESDKFLIIERLLEHGGDKQINFVLASYKKRDIVRVVKESPYLSPRTVSYWCAFYNIDKEATKCYAKQFPHLWPHS